jgi:hypothetical protein
MYLANQKDVRQFSGALILLKANAFAAVQIEN